MILRLFLSLYLVTLVGCASNNSQKTQDSIAANQNAINGFIEAEKSFADSLNSFYKETNAGDYNHKLVSVSGAAYGIGSAVDVDNYQNLQAICDLDNLDTSKTEFAQNWPESVVKKSFHLNADSGSFAKEFAGFNLGGSLDYSKSVIYQKKEMEQVLVPYGPFMEKLADAECAKYLKGKKVMVIKGVIYGKNEISLGEPLVVSAGIKYQDTDLFSFKYDDDLNVTRVDKEPKMLYWVAALIDGNANWEARSSQASKGVLFRPTDEQVSVFVQALKK
jgi:hypothetical protein